MDNYQIDSYSGAEIEALLGKIDDLGNASQSSAGLMSAADKTKLDGLDSGAQANVLEGVKIAGADLPIAEKKVNIPADSSPTSGSNSLVRSGGVFNAIKDFITRSVNDLVNYYTKTEVNNIIGSLQQFHYEIYASTSAVANPQSNVLYLIGPTGTGSDKYEEYVYSNGWVKIGDTTIDLSGYSTTEQMNAAINNALEDYATKEEVSQLGQKTILASSALEFDFEVEASQGAANAQQFDNLSIPSGYYEYCLQNITASNAGSFGIYFFDKSGNLIPGLFKANNQIGVSRCLYIPSDIGRISIGDIGASITTDGTMRFVFKNIFGNLSKIDNIENIVYSDGKTIKGFFINGNTDVNNVVSSYAYPKRATSIDVISYDKDITIKANTGYQIAYLEFNDDGTVKQGFPFASEYTIPANTRFKLNIDKTTVGTTDAVSVEELVQNITITTSAKVYIVDKFTAETGFVGKGETFVTGQNILKVKPGGVVCVVVDPNVDMTGVPATTGYSRFVVNALNDDKTQRATLLNISAAQSLDDKYYIDIPDDLNYIQIGGRCAEGVNFVANIYEVDDYVNFDLSHIYNKINGVTDASGNIQPGSRYRLVSPALLYAHTNIKISAEVGYSYIIVSYSSSGAFVSSTSWLSVESTITKGSYYRVLLQKNNATISVDDFTKLHLLSDDAGLIDVRLKEEVGRVSTKTGLLQSNIESIARLGYDIGQSYTPPENSIAGFVEAYKHNYRSMLADVRWTADGVPVCLHDETINAVARNADGTPISTETRLDSLTLTQVDEYDFGIIKGSAYAGLKIMRLDEFVRWCKLMNVKPYLEIKDFEHKGVSGTLSPAEWGSITSIIDKYGMQDKTAFVLAQIYGQSIDAATLVHQTYPKADICAHQISGNWETDCATWATLKNEFNDIFWYIYDETVMTGKIPNELISAANEYGLTIGYTEIHTESQLDTWLTDVNNLVCTRVAIRQKTFTEYMIEKMLN